MPVMNINHMMSSGIVQTDPIFKIYITYNLKDGPLAGFAWKYVTPAPFAHLKEYIFQHFPEFRNKNLRFYYKGERVLYFVAQFCKRFLHFNEFSDNVNNSHGYSMHNYNADNFYLSVLSDMDIDYMAVGNTFRWDSVPEIFVVPDLNQPIIKVE